MTEGERRIAAVLAQAQMDRDAAAPQTSPLAEELTRFWPTPTQHRRPHDYTQIDPTLADEVQPHAGLFQAIDDARSGKRDDLPAFLAAGATNVAGMPFKMATPEGLSGLAHDAWQAVKAPYNALMSTEPVTTAEMVKPAADIAMLAPLGGVAARAGAGPHAYSNPKEAALPGMVAAGGERQGITAYHGSPHDFDRFSMDKIGTGEGAQAFGHGLYFAERKGVAENYQKKLSRNDVVYYVGGHQVTDKNLIEAAGYVDIGGGGDVLKTISDLRDSLVDYSKYQHDPKYAKLAAELTTKVQAQLDFLVDAYERNLKIEARRGHLYEVRLNADPEHFLDWDKPLSQQSEKVREALKAKADALQADPQNGPRRAGKHVAQHYFDADKPASDTYLSMADSVGGRDAISAHLRDAGIPGIRYLDQNSRTAGEGTRNYVVFRDDIIDIIRKYGWAAAAPMLAQMMAQDDPTPQN